MGWMHHAFPRECPFPHVSGSKNPQTPSEWIDETGRRTETSAQEMQRVVDEALEDNSVGKVSMSISPSISITLTGLPYQSSSYCLMVAPGLLPVRDSSFLSEIAGKAPPFFWMSLTSH